MQLSHLTQSSTGRAIGKWLPLVVLNAVTPANLFIFNRFDVCVLIRGHSWTRFFYVSVRVDLRKLSPFWMSQTSLIQEIVYA